MASEHQWPTATVKSARNGADDVKDPSNTLSPAQERARRSSHCRTADNNAVKEQAMELPTFAVGPPHSFEQGIATRRRDAARQVSTSQNGVSDILKELRDMDERLQFFVERQRLAIQESGLVEDVPLYWLSKSQPARRARKGKIRQHMARRVPNVAEFIETPYAPIPDPDVMAFKDDGKPDELKHETEEDPAKPAPEATATE
ncbi:hypothetical protein VDGL01_11117 [Verticillium dahliae]